MEHKNTERQRIQSTKGRRGCLPNLRTCTAFVGFEVIAEKLGKFTGRGLVPRKTLIRSAQPGILPSHGNVLEVAPEGGIGTITVADFHALVLAHGH